MADTIRAALSQPEPAGLSDEELLRVYGLAKRDHCYEGPIDDWPKRAERAATVAGLRAAIAADRARRPPEPGEVQELVGLIRQSALAWEPDATLLGNMTARQLARAADMLERLSPPQPVPPVPGEVQELVAWLRDNAQDEREMSNGANPASMNLDRAAELLSQRHPQPVPVSERLPGPEDCDAEGRCWLCGKVEGDWRLISVTNSGVPKLSYCFSHWLPAHALPLPVEVES